MAIKPISPKKLQTVLTKKWREMYEERARKGETVWIMQDGKVTEVKAKDCL